MHSFLRISSGIAFLWSVPFSASADILQDCRRNFPDVSFVSLSSAFAKDGRFFFHLSDGRKFYIGEMDVDEADIFSLNMAISGGKPALVVSQNGDLYGPFVAGSAGRYADEEEQKAWSCTILYSSR